MSTVTEHVVDGPPDAETQSARNVIDSFLLAMKNYGMYPEGHPTRQKFLVNVKTSLDAFLEQYGGFRLDIEKEGLFYGDVVIHEVSRGEEDHLASVLFRDGILWLEFLKGIDLKEIATLFELINKNRVLTDEPEGDLATDLWEENPPHIQYEAVDVFWESGPGFDFSILKVVGDHEDDKGGQEGDDATGAESEDTHDPAGARNEQDTEDAASSAVGSESTQLTPQEQKKLRGLVIEEESWDNVEDVLDVLLIILDEQDQEEGFSGIVEVLREHFEDTVAQGQLPFILDTLKRLREIYRSSGKEKSWRRTGLKNFFFSIATPQVLGPLHSVLPSLESGNMDQTKMFRQIFILLPPKAMQVLGPMLLKASSKKAQRHLMEIIGNLAIKDLRPLEDLLNHPEELLVERLVLILRHLKGEKPFELLVKMTDHPSQRVRRTALTELLKRDPKALKRVFFLIEDPSPRIRHQIIDYLGREKSQVSENLLREYLEKKEFGITEDQHPLACYRALGRCGSSISIPFLEETLMGRDWSDKMSFRTSPHRQGAAIALSALRTEDAEKILENASRSLSPGIRRAYQRAVERSK